MNTRQEDDAQYQWLLDRRRDARQGIRWLRIMVYGACAIAVVLIWAGRADAAVKSTKVDTPTVVLKRGSSTVATFPTIEHCRLQKPLTIEADGVAKETGSGVYDCDYKERTRVAFGPNPATPVCTAAKPAQLSQVQTCPAGTVGTWSQTMDHVAAAYPTCWTPGQWTPATAPAGICATAQLRVYACPEAGADGRILESATVSWPNCATAAFKNPSTSLVVATNDDGVLRWRSALNATGRVWTQTGTVMAWTRVEDINWGTVAPAAGTANLRWLPPTENTNGTALTDLAGYRILYGTNGVEFSKEIPVSGSVTSYVITQLPPATYYFAIVAFNAAGQQSYLSPVAKVAVQ